MKNEEAFGKVFVFNLDKDKADNNEFVIPYAVSPETRIHYFLLTIASSGDQAKIRDVKGDRDLFFSWNVLADEERAKRVIAAAIEGQKVRVRSLKEELSQEESILSYFENLPQGGSHENT